MNSEQNIDISVVIVNWNTCGLLKDCLESVIRTTIGLAYEIIVVDNASNDGSVEMVQQDFPRVRLIVNDKNRGFGAANNQALRVMTGRYALLLNSDTVLTPGAVQELLSFMDHHNDVAMACGQLLNADGSKQHSFAAFPTLVTLTANMPLLEYCFPRSYPSKRYDYAEPIEVDSCIGACMMVRKEAMDEVGYFDERYFFFFEETDWAYAMRKAGWKIYYVPTAFVYHLQGQSIGVNVQSRIEFYRSRYQYFRKWNRRRYYRLVCTIIFIRLLANWSLTTLANLTTLATQKTLRDKWKVYSSLIRWHIDFLLDIST